MKYPSPSISASVSLSLSHQTEAFGVQKDTHVTGWEGCVEEPKHEHGIISQDHELHVVRLLFTLEERAVRVGHEHTLLQPMLEGRVCVFGHVGRDIGLDNQHQVLSLDM